MAHNDFLTHAALWRQSLNAMLERAETDDDRSFWQHELRAFDAEIVRQQRQQETLAAMERLLHAPDTPKRG